MVSYLFLNHKANFQNYHLNDFTLAIFANYCLSNGVNESLKKLVALNMMALKFNSERSLNGWQDSLCCMA